MEFKDLFSARHLSQRSLWPKLPFEELFVPKFQMQAQWSLEQWVGYLQTYLKKNQEKNQSNPIEVIWPELQKAWQQPSESQSRKIQWQLSVRAFRIRV